MTSPELESLVRTGQLKREANSQSEFDKLVKSGVARLMDANNVFQALPHTLGLPTETWRVLAKAHERRNMSEYEGVFDVDERLLKDMLAAAQLVLKGVKALR